VLEGEAELTIGDEVVRATAGRWVAAPVGTVHGFRNTGRRTLDPEGVGYFEADELYASEDGEPTARLRLAFHARDREAVHAFYEATLAVGGRDNGTPGERE
jgi:uncharacterized cupin superfamily protein